MRGAGGFLVVVVALALAANLFGAEEQSAPPPALAPEGPAKNLVTCLDEAGMEAARIDADSVRVLDPATGRGALIHRFRSQREARRFHEQLSVRGHRRGKEVAALGYPPIPPDLETAALTCLRR